MLPRSSMSRADSFHKSTKSLASSAKNPSRSFDRIFSYNKKLEVRRIMAFKSKGSIGVGPKSSPGLKPLTINSPKMKRVPSVLSSLPEGCLTSDEVLNRFAGDLSVFERKEVLSYPFIYYHGLPSVKIQANPKLENNGFDVEGIYSMIPHDHVAYRYEILEKLGEGTFSQVYSARDHKENKTVAIKAVKNGHLFLEQSLQEVDILQTLSKEYMKSSYSIEINDHFSFRNHRFLVFDLLPKSLYQHIRERKTLMFKQVVRISYQLLYALTQIHRKGIIHCDLKTENIMFTDLELSFIKVIDFGSACIDNKDAYQYVQSRFYRAPEVILGCNYNSAIDIWSFGCILLEMLIGRAPFRGEDANKQFRSIMEYLGYPPHYLVFAGTHRAEFMLPQGKGKGKLPGSKCLSEIVENSVLLDLVEKCLEWDPFKRITAAEALKHPLFARSNLRVKRK